MSDEGFAVSTEPDPSRIQTPADFGRELSRARIRAGLAVRDLAARAGVPPGTLSGYLTGQHLPQTTFLEPFRRVLAACGEGAPQRMSQWEEAVRRVRRVPGRRSASSPAPYPGLRSFQPQDAALFCGRDDETAEIVRRVTDRPPGAGGGLLMVVGASGAGKSSLLRAGVLPALERLGIETVLVVPGAAARAQAAAWAGDAGEGAVRVLVVDQFEEALIPDGDGQPDLEFIAALNALGARTAAVLGMRADFYLEALRHPHLAAALQDNQVIVRPMTAQALRQAITEPARQSGLTVESGLVELILRDLAPRTRDGGGQAAHDLGALPFFSHALRETWRVSRGRRLTVEDYLAAGGVERSIARVADEVLEQLTEPQREVARRLMLRLVRADEGLASTRRRVPLGEVLGIAGGDGTPDRGGARSVLEAFVAARLLTVDNDRVEITHEALLHAWPALHEWLEGYRDWIRIHRRITEAAEAWNTAGRDEFALARGGLLQLMTDWVGVGGFRTELNALEAEFHDASVRRQQAELAQQRRRGRRRLSLTALVTALVLIAAAVGAFALQERATSSREALEAASRYVADESDRLRSSDTSLALQLALAAFRIWPTPEARASLIDATDATPGTRVMVPGRPFSAMTVGGPGEDELATAATPGDTVLLWHLGSPTDITGPVGPALTGPAGPVQALALTRSGSLLAAGDTTGRISLWTRAGATAARPLAPLRVPVPGASGAPVAVTSLAFSPDGRELAVGAGNGVVYRWSLADLAAPTSLAPLTGLPYGSTAVAYSADGALLAAGSRSTVRLWDTAAPEPGSASPAPVDREPISTGGSVVFGLAISPDGRTLAVGVSEAHSALLWNISDPARPVAGRVLSGPTSWVNAVAFSPDGTELAAGSSDGMLWIFDPATGKVLRELPHPRPVDALAYGPDGSILTYADDGTVRSWAPTGPVITAPRDTIFALGFNQAGSEMLVGPGADDNTETLWNVTDIDDPREIGGPLAPQDGETFAGTGAISPDGTKLAVGDLDGTVQLFTTDGSGTMHAAGPPAKAAGALVEAVDIDHAGGLLAVSNDEGTVPLWDIAVPARPRQLAVLASETPGSYTYQAVFSQNDQLLAVESSDGRAYLWSVADPSRPRRLATLGGFSGPAYSAVFFDGDKYLAVGSADSTVRVWDVSEPSRPVPVGGPLTGPIGYIYSVAYDPRRRILAVGGSTDGTIALWDMTDPAKPVLLADVTGPAGGVLSVAFSPDGDTLVAGGHDHTVHLWNVDTVAAASWICGVAGQPITRAEWAEYVPGLAYAPPCGTGSATPDR